MKSKIILVLMLALGGSVVAEETVTEMSPQETVEQNFGYVSFGLGPFPIPLPAFAGGWRMQSGHHGMDVSLSVQTAVVITALKANLLYHHYFNPSLTSQFYVGGGVGSGVIWGEERGVGISPEFVFGKQYRNESNDLRFFQLQTSFPTFVAREHYHHWRQRSDICWFPLVIISYGIGF